VRASINSVWTEYGSKGNEYLLLADDDDDDAADIELVCCVRWGGKSVSV
jgi:hypothetical protein